LVRLKRSYTNSVRLNCWSCATWISVSTVRQRLAQLCCARHFFGVDVWQS